MSVSPTGCELSEGREYVLLLSTTLAQSTHQLNADLSVAGHYERISVWCLSELYFCLLNHMFLWVNLKIICPPRDGYILKGTCPILKMASLYSKICQAFCSLYYENSRVFFFGDDIECFQTIHMRTIFTHIPNCFFYWFTVWWKDIIFFSS